jgi:hypothetical protein
MSWLLPSALIVAGVAALATIALHFIARSRPVAESLPTARFVPHRPVHARARSMALSDVLLLLLRVAAVLVLGAAVAAPVFAAARGRVTRIILADRSRDVADVREARDSVRALLRDGDVLVAFDTAAARVSGTAIDSAPVDAAGSLSSALAMAIRVAAQISAKSDSIELDVVSPLAVEELDDATLKIRAEWPGRVRVVPLRAPTTNARAPRVESNAAQNDIVLAGLSLAGVLRPSGDVRVVRGHATAADSAWARDSGNVLVHWPVSDSAADWQPRATIDAIGGVTSSSGTLIGRFPRAWTLNGRALARWVDGEPAAVEHSIGRGCIRDVGIVFDPASDITLRAPFRQFVARLLEPCGGIRRTERADSAVIAALAGGSELPRFAPATALRDRTTESSSRTPWLLGLGALLLIIELVARRMDRRLA